MLSGRHEPGRDRHLHLPGGTVRVLGRPAVLRAHVGAGVVPAQEHPGLGRGEEAAAVPDGDHGHHPVRIHPGSNFGSEQSEQSPNVRSIPFLANNSNLRISDRSVPRSLAKFLIDIHPSLSP